MQENVILDAIKTSLDRLSLELTDIDRNILIEWGNGLYGDGWKNCKQLLVKK